MNKPVQAHTGLSIIRFDREAFPCEGAGSNRHMNPNVYSQDLRRDTDNTK